MAAKTKRGGAQKKKPAPKKTGKPRPKKTAKAPSTTSLPLTPPLDSSKKESKWGGKRPGAGRRKGSANKATLERMAVMRQLEQRIMGAADRLFEAQFTLARGTSHLYRVDMVGDKRTVVLVTDTEEIRAYFDALEQETEPDGFYFITAEKPDNRAIDSMLDRAFGKSVARHELSGPGGVPLIDPTKLNDQQLDWLEQIVAAAMTVKEES